MTAPPPPAIRLMREDDWPAVSRILALGIEEGDATFETRVPTWANWDAGHHRRLRFVAEVDRVVRGWSAALPVSSRPCYAGVVEDSVYVDPAFKGLGIGRALLTALLDAAGAEGVWTVQAGIFPENLASLELHQRCGFRVVGRRERLGRLGDVWRDVLLLESRLTDPRSPDAADSRP